jgi:hypothetical protein
MFSFSFKILKEIKAELEFFFLKNLTRKKIKEFLIKCSFFSFFFGWWRKFTFLGLGNREVI